MSVEEKLSEISHRIIDIQTALVSLQEKHRNESHRSEQQFDRWVVGIIEMLDLLEPFLAAPQPSSSPTDQDRVFRKTGRRLQVLLENFGVREIQIDSAEFRAGHVRVLEMRGLSKPQICRKGYTRNDRVLRAVEIIT